MSKPLVLLVEPDKLLASNAQRFLQKAGYKTSWAASAQQAVEQADKQTPSVIVLDLQLAGHGGIEFLHELRSYGDWQKVPVIIYSSVHADEFGGKEQATSSLTAVAYLHKSTTSLSELADAIQTSLQASS